jgi:hypothetical protein
MLNKPLDKFWNIRVRTWSRVWSVTTLIQHYMLTTCICNDTPNGCVVWTLDEFCSRCKERIW